MKCVFCEQKCQMTSLADDDRNKSWPDKWKCDHHTVPVEYWTYKFSFGKEQPFNIRYCFKVIYKSGMYRIYYQIDNGLLSKKNPICFRVEKQFPNISLILELDFLPLNITPENILEKLPTLILFS